MTAPRTVTVTPRQWDVLVELCRDGASNKEIGRRLYMSEDTVKTHMRRLIAAFGKQDRAALICAVLRREVTPVIGSKVPRPLKPITHGTWGGYLQHRRRDEPMCDPCGVIGAEHLAVLHASRRKKAA